MPIVSESFHYKNLKEKGFKIKTTYKNNNKVSVRSSDNSINEDVKNGIRLRKEYYKDDRLLHTVTDFDSRITYTYINQENENQDMKCPNCGMSGKVKDFIDGCPYCRTKYNIEYTEKDLGTKHHYDRVLRNNTYRLITLILDIIISFIICFIYFKNTSRTFNQFDILKIVVYTIIVSGILYYFFYLLDGYIILLPIKIYKDKMNQKQIDFWNKMNKLGIDKNKFYNNMNYEINKYYYQKTNIIDYDILDCLEFKDSKDKDGNIIITSKIDIRTITYSNNKIKENHEDVTFSFLRREGELFELHDGKNYIKCPNCGGSCDVTKEKCDHCRTELKHYQEWIMIDKKD
jgi:predicted RNA-binding Zn-ribbon protein involved in translation (DUF1610 family)